MENGLPQLLGVPLAGGLQLSLPSGMPQLQTGLLIMVTSLPRMARTP